MTKLKPNEQQAKAVIITLWTVLALYIASLISAILQYNLFQTIASGGYVSEQVAKANDIRVGIVALFLLISYIVLAITFLMWFRRAYYNLHQKVSSLSHSVGWAVGCWFVPLMNLYRPFQIMKEMYDETQKLINGRELSKRVDYTTTYVGWWWTFWIITGILNGIAWRFERNAFTINDFIAVTTFDIVIYATSIILTLFAIKVVRDYSKVEPLLNEIKDEEQQVAETLTEKTDNAL